MAVGTAFWMQATERAVKTGGQALVAVAGVGWPAMGSIPWTAAVDVALVAAFLSYVTSVSSVPFGEPDSPSAIVLDYPDEGDDPGDDDFRPLI